ncbi:GTP-binding conserved hypothetical domain-containing protein, putative [Eimeria brunetti]|uniref:GTP-binding conserved hypothetical domain-containing protein, putative n=1 Tax=Eimeria brunetti TaxID=51314 RepID=U6LSF1_9EIME|nr:GTP-binding conserved hypothetical domain-containing protein, putative [Eimeria brunetti]
MVRPHTSHAFSSVVVLIFCIQGLAAAFVCHVCSGLVFIKLLPYASIRFPSFARRSLVPLVQAASRCDAIVEVRDARLPLLSRCNLRVLQLRKPTAVILTHADQLVQASPVATRQWQRYFRRESREAAALELHAELTRARRQVQTAGLLRALSDTCPLAPRLPHLFIDAREPAAIVRVQRLLRSLVKRHRRYRKELDAFRSLCKQAAAAAAEAKGVDSPGTSAQVAQLIASHKARADEPEHSGEVLTRALLRQRKPLRILVVGFPNVGKSKIANSLVGRKVARSYRWPGTTQSVNLHRQPVTLARVGDMSRLFDVVDTPGFIPVHPGKGKSKRRLNFSEERQLQQRLGTSARQRQLDLGLFFDFTHPRLSPDELALLGAFHMLPHSCLFTIEEAAVALGDAFFRIRKLLPAASDLDRVMTRYKMTAEAFKEDFNMGVQLLLTLAEKRHHSNEGAAAQRLLSDFTQGYLGRHTFELPPMRYAGGSASSPTTKRIVRNWDAGGGNNVLAADRSACLGEDLPQAAPDKGVQRSSASDDESYNKQICARAQMCAREAAAGRRWTMRRHGDRLSFVLDARSPRETSPSEECTLGLGVPQEAQRQPTAIPTNTCGEFRKAYGQGDDSFSVGTADYAEGRKQQQQLLAVGWLEGW